VERGDEALAAAVAHRLGLVRSDRWPLIAAHLVAAGHDGPAVVELAGLSNTASGWEVDQLLPDVLAELPAPDLSDALAGEVAARLLGQGLPDDGHPIIRTLAQLAPGLDYPTGPIGRSYYLEEWLDCDCHKDSNERRDATAYEAELRALPPLNISDALAEALAGRE
jgi:hypothetical protein